MVILPSYTSILREVLQRTKNRERAIVLISGQGGLGKSTLASFLSGSDEQIEFTSVDGYLEPRSARPEASEGDLLVPYEQVRSDIQTFLHGGKIRLRRYDHDRGVPCDNELMTDQTTRILVVEGGLIATEVDKEEVALSVLFRSEIETYIKHRSNLDRFRGLSPASQDERNQIYRDTWGRFENDLLQKADLVFFVNLNDFSISRNGQHGVKVSPLYRGKSKSASGKTGADQFPTTRRKSP